MSNLEIFDNYIKLDYQEGPRRLHLLDKSLGNFIILRKNYTGDSIIYLTNGNSLFIPWIWIDLFSGFYNNSGNQVLYGNKPKDYFNLFIHNMTELQLFTLNNYSKIDGSVFLNTLGDICNLGTKKFIEKYKNEIKLEPFEFNSINKNFEI